MDCYCPPGRIVLLKEFENKTENLIGEYFRVAGRLVYYSMSKNLAVIEQNVKYTTDRKGKQQEGQPYRKVKTRKCFLIVDTKLVENEPYKECKIAEFLGLLINDDISDPESTSKFYQLPQNIKEMITENIQKTRFPLLEARTFRNVDFMDMDIYQNVVNMRKKHESDL